ncbi:hypothetical protein BKA93DRAFT_728848 [Sparassis latifolia]
MVDWSSQEEIERDTTAYTNLVFTLFGLYIWELFQTSNFEWSLITRKRDFAWPLVLPFFLCRYCLLWALIGLLISFSVIKHVNCQALYTFNSWTGNMAILCASTSLMLRTIALWERKLKIVIPLGILCLAHWALLWRGMFVIHAVYDTATEACEVTYTNHVFLNISFFATMVFDLAILLLTIAALVPLTSRSSLVRMLFHDGLVYFLVTFLFNSVPAILAVINLNREPFCVISIPAATFSAIAACRAVIRLQEFAHGDIYVHNASQLPSPGGRTGNVHFGRMSGVGVPSATAVRLGGAGGLKAQPYVFARPEVHVTTDQFVMEDFG